MQMFARKYPQEVTGLILIDSSSPNEPDGVFVSQSKLPVGTIDYFEDAGVSENRRSRRFGCFLYVGITPSRSNYIHIKAERVQLTVSVHR